MSEMITLKFLGDGTVECEDPWAFGDLVKGAKASEVPAPAAIDLATFVGLAKVATRIDRLEEIVGRILAAIEGAEDGEVPNDRKDASESERSDEKTGISALDQSEVPGET